MDWRKSFAKLFDASAEKVLDGDSYPQVLLFIFESVTSPSLYISADGTLTVPPSYSIKVGGGYRPSILLQETEIFLSLPGDIQHAALDLMYILVRRDTYDVSRFQSKIAQLSRCTGTTDIGMSLNTILLKLLKTVKARWESAGSNDNKMLLLQRKIVRLLGNTFLAGCTSGELKEIFKLLRRPTVLTIPLLQSLKMMTKQDSAMAKASPSSFFNFGGFESGLFSVLGNFPFSREYHIFTWFRVDQFTEGSKSADSHSRGAVGSGSGNGSSSSNRQTIAAVLDANGHGISIFIEDHGLYLSITEPSSKGQVLMISIVPAGARDVRLMRGVWYHISVRHVKPRLAFFARDELTIHLDHNLVFHDSIKFPGSSQLGPVSLMCGKDFNGQLGPIYFLSEAIPPSAVEAIARLDAGKVNNESNTFLAAGLQGTFHASMSTVSMNSSAATPTAAGMSTGPTTGSGSSAASSSTLSSFSSTASTASDLQQFVLGTDKKMVSVAGKFASVFHPDRCCYGHALDIHGGRHASIGPYTYSWTIHSPKDVLESIGGISCLLPMFPKLLIETGPENYRYLLSMPNVVSSRILEGGVCSRRNISTAFPGRLDSDERDDEASSTVRGSLLDADLVEEMESEYLDAAASDNGCVGLLLSIIARCLSNNRVHQKNFATLRGVELLEFALNCIPAEIMAAEGDGCILALLQLRTAVSDNASLESRVNKRLICNFALWSKCSFAFQSSLLAVVISIARTQPDYFLQVIGVHGVLDLLSSCYMDATGSSYVRTDTSRLPSPAKEDAVATPYSSPIPASSTGADKVAIAAEFKIADETSNKMSAITVEYGTNGMIDSSTNISDAIQPAESSTSQQWKSEQENHPEEPLKDISPSHSSDLHNKADAPADTPPRHATNDGRGATPFKRRLSLKSIITDQHPSTIGSFSSSAGIASASGPVEVPVHTYANAHAPSPKHVAGQSAGADTMKRISSSHSFRRELTLCGMSSTEDTSTFEGPSSLKNHVPSTPSLLMRNISFSAAGKERPTPLRPRRIDSQLTVNTGAGAGAFTESFLSPTSSSVNRMPPPLSTTRRQSVFRKELSIRTFGTDEDLSSSMAASVSTPARQSSARQLSSLAAASADINSRHQSRDSSPRRPGLRRPSGGTAAGSAHVLLSPLMEGSSTDNLRDFEAPAAVAQHLHAEGMPGVVDFEVDGSLVGSPLQSPRPVFEEAVGGADGDAGGDDDPLANRLLSSAGQTSPVLDPQDGARIRADGDDVECEEGDDVYDNADDEEAELVLAEEYAKPTLSREQRRHLRMCLLSIIMGLITYSPSEKEVRPLLQFLAVCRDPVVLNDVSQLLLSMLVDGNTRVLSVITEISHGVEEFASLILHRVIQMPEEDVRCTGMRLLTHFYLRIENLPMSLLMMTARKKKTNFLNRAKEKINLLTGGSGLQRLQASGGVAMLCEILSAYLKDGYTDCQDPTLTKSSTSDLTYLALLEMLLMRPGGKSQATIQYSSVFDAPSLATQGGDTSSASATQKATPGFAAASASLALDETVGQINPIALPLVFDILPKLPLAVQGRVVSDLLALIKHNFANRREFCAVSSWHLCMYGLVMRFIARSSDLTFSTLSTEKVASELEKRANRILPLSEAHLEHLPPKKSFRISPNASRRSSRRGSFDLHSSPGASDSESGGGRLLRGWARGDDGEDSGAVEQRRHAPPARPHILPLMDAMLSPPALSYAATSPLLKDSLPQQGMPLPYSGAHEEAGWVVSEPTMDLNLWFALGMKTYASLLLHCLDNKGGWREIDRTIAQSIPIIGADGRDIDTKAAVYIRPFDYENNRRPSVIASPSSYHVISAREAPPRDSSEGTKKIEKNCSRSEELASAEFAEFETVKEISNTDDYSESEDVSPRSNATDDYAGASEPTQCADGSVSRAVLSHLVSETTFSIRSKYRDLQKLSKSASSTDQQMASDRLENILSLIVTCSQYALGDRSTASFSLEHMHIGRLRSYYYTESEEAYFQECRRLQQQTAAQLVDQAFASADDDPAIDTIYVAPQDLLRARRGTISPTSPVGASSITSRPQSGATSPAQPDSGKTPRTTPRIGLFGTTSPQNIVPDSRASRCSSPVPMVSEGAQSGHPRAVDGIPSTLVDLPPPPNFFDEAEKKLLTRFKHERIRKPGLSVDDDDYDDPSSRMGSFLRTVESSAFVSELEVPAPGAGGTTTDTVEALNKESTPPEKVEQPRLSKKGSTLSKLFEAGDAGNGDGDDKTLALKSPGKEVRGSITQGADRMGTVNPSITELSQQQDALNESRSEASDCEKIEEYFNFRYRWLDITPDDSLNSSSPPRRRDVDASKPTGSAAAGSRRIRTSITQAASMLPPLERQHSPKEGQLVLVLQTLRLFDSLFWPRGRGPLRNRHMLRFVKDDATIEAKRTLSSNRPLTAPTQVQQLSASMTSGSSSLPARLRPSLISIPSAATIMSAIEPALPLTGRYNKNNNPSQPERVPQAVPVIAQSLYTSALRMSIFTLQTLSPFSELAAQNVRRLTELIDVPGRIASASSPLDDWCLAAVLQVTVALQRISTALAPIYSGVLTIPPEYAELHVSLFGVIPATLLKSSTPKGPLSDETAGTLATGEFEMYTTDDSFDEDEVLEEEEEDEEHGGEREEEEEEEDQELSTIHRLTVTDTLEEIHRVSEKSDPNTDAYQNSEVLGTATETPIGEARRGESNVPIAKQMFLINPVSSRDAIDEMQGSNDYGGYTEQTERQLFQEARHNHKILNRLLKLFSSQEGRNLEQFVRDCMQLLVRVFDIQRELLMVSLDPRIFALLDAFTRRNASLQECFSFVDNTTNAGTGSGSPADSSKISAARSDSLSRQAQFALHGAGAGGADAANAKHNHGGSSVPPVGSCDDDDLAAEELFVSTLGPLDSIKTQPSQEPSRQPPVSLSSSTVDQPSANVTKAHRSSSISAGYGTGTGTVTVTSSSVNSTADELTNPALTSMRQSNDSAFSRYSGSADKQTICTTPDAKRQNSPRVPRSPRSPRGGDERLRTAKQTLRTLSLLRDAYLKVDPLRSIGVVKAVTSLDLFESTCCSCFVEELKSLRAELETHRGMEQRGAEDAAELRELSTIVLSSLVSQERSRLSAVHAHDAIELKHTAATWHKCLCALEMDWSPWSEQEEIVDEALPPKGVVRDGDDKITVSQNECEDVSENKNKTVVQEEQMEEQDDDERGKAYFELSKHKDSKMRRFVMMKLPDAIDHSSEAYLDGKQRDQQIFETSSGSGTVGSPTTVASVAAGSSSPMVANLNLRGLAKSLATNARSRRASGLTAVGSSAVGGGAGGPNGLLSLSADALDQDDVDDDSGRGGAVDRLSVETGGGRRASFSGMSSISAAGGSTGIVGPANGGVSILEGIASTVGTVFTGQAAGVSLDKRPQWTQSFYWAPDEKMHMLCHARQVELEHMISGMLLLTNKAMYFHPKKVVGGLGMTPSTSVSGEGPDYSLSPQVMQDRRWQLDRLVEIYRRRYLLQNCAIELFFADVPEVFFALDSTSDLQKLFRLVRKQNVPLLLPYTSRSLNPRTVCAQSPWTDLWRRRLISNFEYLMRLNIMAGRSYNDITQYPVFPWILADYTSNVLDLQNPLTFRDLSKPIGALNPERLHEFIERYNSLDDDTVPKFMYGSHYSSAGVVIHYMVRQEPFTTLAVNLQGGRFDCPDRVFFEFKSTWDGCNKSMSDVKELIPEMFCCPEALINTNKLPLGKLQDTAQVVDDVVLPPWARGDPFEFVRLNREALESDYVSEHLHEWIDLIFGYKQTGPASVEAHNVFYYLTYEDAVDLDAIKDPLQREAAKAQVLHFGQTPSQLFTREHPRRLPREECMVPLCADIYNISHLTVFTPSKQQYMVNLGGIGDASAAMNKSHGGVISIKCSADRLVTVHADLSVSTYRWSSFPDGEGSPFQLRADAGRVKPLPCASLARSELELRRKSFVPAPRITPHPLSSSPYRQKLPTSHQRRIFGNFTLAAASETEQMSSSIAEPLSTAPSSDIPATGSAIGATSTFDLSLSWFRDPFRRTLSTQVAPPPKPQSNASTIPSTPAEGSILNGVEGGVVGGRSIRSASQITDINLDREIVTRSRSASDKSFGRSDDESDGDDDKDEEDGTVSASVSTSTDTFRMSRADTDATNGWTDSIDANTRNLKLSEFGNKNVALNIGEGNQGRVISCGYWDNSLKVHALDTLKEVVNSGGVGSGISGHMGEITCVQLGYKGGQLLITGGADGTCRVWVLESPSLVASLNPDRGSGSTAGLPAMTPMASVTQANASSAPQSSGSVSSGPATTPSSNVGNASGSGSADDALGANSELPVLTCVHILCGHSSPITAISYAPDPDIIFSASKDGLLCVHTVRKGQYIRSITHMMRQHADSCDSPRPSSEPSSCADIVLVTSPGYLLAHSWSNLKMHVFWINGQHRATVEVSSKVEAMAVNGSGNVLVCGHADGTLSLRALWNLQQTHRVDHSTHGAIRSLCFTDDCQFLLIGSEDGSFSVGTDPDVRWKMLHAAIQKTPLLGPTI